MNKSLNNNPGRSSATAFYLLFLGMFGIFLGLGASIENYLQSMFLTRESFETSIMVFSIAIIGWQLVVAGLKNAWSLGYDWLILGCCLIFYNEGLRTEDGRLTLMGYAGLLYAAVQLINLDQSHWFDQLTKQIGEKCTKFRDNYHAKKAS